MRELILSGLILLYSAYARAGEPEFVVTDALPGFASRALINETCPADAITGQNPIGCGTTQWYFYSDLDFYSGTQSVRVRCEDFPKTGLLDPNDPNQWIGTIIWYGVNIDVNSGGCSKGPPGTYQFRIRFYDDNAGAPDPNFVYEEIVTPAMLDTGGIETFAPPPWPPATVWQYTAVLTVPRQMTHGWFSICGTGDPTCWSLWGGSGDGGDNKFYQWWEVNGTIPGSPVTVYCDLSYCFGVKAIGACCDECTQTCTDNVAEVACQAMGGRFLRDQPCSVFGSDPNIPACGEGLGACCHNDGTCAMTTCLECVGGGNPCYPCIGDLDCDCDRDADDLNCMFGGCDPWCFDNFDCNGDGVVNFDDIDCLLALLSDPNNWGPCGSCRGDCDCSGGVGFDDINPLVLALSDPAAYAAAYPNCDVMNADCNGDGVVNFDDINAFVARLGTVCQPARNRSNRWLGPSVLCDQCCKVDCNDPNYGVTHSENEPCGQDLNGGCNALADPNDPNSPVDPNAWEHLGVIDSNSPMVVCGTLWADNGTRDTDWYDFSLSTRGTLAWTADSDLPIVTTPIFGNENLSPPTILVNCHGGPLWGFFNLPSDLPCFHGEWSSNDIFPAGVTYWWVVFPDSGHAIFYGYPCEDGWNNYRVTISLTAVVCDPCLPTDIHETEPGCGPDYVDAFNAGCDAAAGLPVQAALDPNFFYCGQTGTWADPNGDVQVDYDWWKIVLHGTVNKRLQIQMQAAFNLQYELYSVPGDNCANKVRLDYYEFGACEANITIQTACLAASNSVYYLRIVPTSVVDCAQYNTYRFQYSVVAEAPACTACSVTCSTNVDDVCQADPNGPETNAGCDAANPNDPNRYMSFTVGNNTYGAKYCGRLSTFTGSDGTPRADLDWFRYTQPFGRTKLVIRAKAMFRMSISIGQGCIDPNRITHGWDRPCKGTTTAATQTYTGLTPNTIYNGVIMYGNGGGDGTGEPPLKQFFLGLPCSDNRNTYEVELQAQT